MKKNINIFVCLLLLTSCANIVAPSGGDQDFDPPRILKTSVIEKPNNTHYKSIVFEFDEYIQLNNWQENFYISPPIKKTIHKQVKGKTLHINIKDTLNANTDFYIVLNSCIKDNNEGNVLDTLSYEILNSNRSKSNILSGNLKDAYSLAPLGNAWIMIFNDDVNDTMIFKETPNYIARTDKKGFFYFPNLKDINYKIVALTGFDFIYNEEEKIAFLHTLLNAKSDSFISLYAFNPIITDSAKMTPKESQSDSVITSVDSIFATEEFPLGKLEIITNRHEKCIFQLLQNDNVIAEIYFAKKPYLIDSIDAGEYQLKYIADRNQDSIWNTGNWEKRIQPEEVFNYPSVITIRSNWDLQLDWIIEE
jgi:hypothetical protein